MKFVSLFRDQKETVRITPHPVLIRFERSDDWMVGGMVVAGSMLVLGLVAAADISAGHTHTQVDPGISLLEAFQAALGVAQRVALGICHGRLDLIYVRAGGWILA